MWKTWSLFMGGPRPGRKPTQSSPRPRRRQIKCARTVLGTEVAVRSRCSTKQPTKTLDLTVQLRSCSKQWVCRCGKAIAEKKGPLNSFTLKILHIKHFVSIFCEEISAKVLILLDPQGRGTP